MKKLIALLLVLVMLVGCLAACGNNEETQPSGNTPAEPTGTTPADPTESQPIPEGEPQVGGIVTYSWYELSPTFDPYGQSSWTTYMWANNNFEPCLARGEDGVIYPLVCNYDYAEDGMTLKLWVREGVKFSDGTDVTIEDVLASLQRAALFTPKVKTALWDVVDTYDITDGVLTFNFKEFNIATFGTFSNPRASYGGIMPKWVCDKYGENLIDDPNDCIGTGPYKLDPEESQAGVRYEFVRNEHYVACEESPDHNGLASPRRQYLDGIVVLKNADNSSQLMALMNGELSALAQQDVTAFNTNLEPNGYTANTYSTGGVYYLFYNCNEKRAVADVNLRRAIAAILDYDELQIAVRGDLYDPSVNSPVACGTAYETDAFSNAEWTAKRESNKEVAKKYLDQSSYNGETLIMITDNSAAAAVFIEDLESIGINCNRQNLDNPTMIAYANDGTLDWDMILRTNPISQNYPAEMNNSFYNNWHNERALELIALLDTVPVNSDKSVAYWNELAELMADEVPFIIFGAVEEFFVSAPGLVNDRQGVWRYWFNDWWTDPAAHMG